MTVIRVRYWTRCCAHCGCPYALTILRPDSIRIGRPKKTCWKCRKRFDCGSREWNLLDRREKLEYLSILQALVLVALFFLAAFLIAGRELTFGPGLWVSFGFVVGVPLTLIYSIKLIRICLSILRVPRPCSQVEANKLMADINAKVLLEAQKRNDFH